MADQQRARALFGLALNATAVVGWAALLLIFRIHPPEPRHPGLVVVVALMRCLVSLYLRHSATPWQPRAAVSDPSMMSLLLGTFRPSRGSRAPPTPQSTREIRRDANRRAEHGRGRRRWPVGVDGIPKLGSSPPQALGSAVLPQLSVLGRPAEPLLLGGPGSCSARSPEVAVPPPRGVA